MSNFLKNNIDNVKSVVFINKKICQPFYALCIILCASLSSHVQSHPHSWIDLKTVIEGDQNQITGFRMSWTFDAITSAYMLDGEDLSEANKANALQEMADGILDNLALEHYFTFFYSHETPIKYTLATDGGIVQNRTKLTLNFFLPLSKPRSIDGESFELQIYESSYYVQMSWRQKEHVTLSPNLAEHCSIQVVEPQPTVEQFNYATAKPANAEVDNELGSLFTQKVKLNCPLKKG